MLPITPDSASMPVPSGARSYRCGMTITSIPGSIKSPATISSSSCRLAGLALWPCETTTAMRLLIHLTFDCPLRDFPDAFQVLDISGRVEQGVAGRFDFKQPAGPVLV